MLLQKSRIARIEPFGLLKIGFALVPFTTTPRNVGQRLGYLTGVWQKLLCLVKIAECSVVILQDGILVVGFCIYRLTKLWLQGKGSLSSAPGFLAQRQCLLHCPTDVAAGVYATKERPGHGELWIDPHRLPELPLGRKHVCGNVSASDEE